MSTTAGLSLFPDKSVNVKGIRIITPVRYHYVLQLLFLYQTEFHFSTKCMAKIQEKLLCGWLW